MAKVERIIGKIVLGIVFWVVLGMAYLFMANVAFGAERQKEIIASSSEQDISDLEQVVYWESVRAGAPIETSMAVVETICNRVTDNSGYFPNTISKVIRQKGQFSTVKCFGREKIPEAMMEEVSDSISEVVNSETTILPYDDYIYFDMKKWGWGKDWIWIGQVDKNGNPIKHKGMWFGRKK